MQHREILPPRLTRSRAVCDRSATGSASAAALLKQFPNFVVSGFFGQNLVASENPSRIGVHHEDRMIAGVEQDGIGSFGADSIQIEKFFPKLLRRLRE